MPGFNIKTEIGSAALLLASTVPAKQLDSKRKHVFLDAQLAFAKNGWKLPSKQEIERIGELVEEWIEYWDKQATK